MQWLSMFGELVFCMFLFDVLMKITRAQRDRMLGGYELSACMLCVFVYVNLCDIEVYMIIMCM